jgi:enolase
MSAATIVAVAGRRVYDSRGRPTVEADVVLQGGARGRAIAPAGASRGSREAVDLRDGGAAHGGFDVTKALDGARTALAAAIRGLDARDQPAVDAALIAADGTEDKSRLGGNAIVAVSLAVAHAAAAAAGVPLWRYLAGAGPVTLPLPEIQIFGGGAHAHRRLDLQDVMVMPVGAATFAAALAVVADVYRAAGELMAARGRVAGVADEGGWWPQFDDNEDALRTLVAAIERAGYAPGADVAISPHPSCIATAAIVWRSTAATSTRPRSPTCGSTGSIAIRSRRSRIRSPRTTATRGGRSRARRATACRSSATTT